MNKSATKEDPVGSARPHYKWGDNCDSWVLVNTRGLSVKKESMPAGTAEKRHFHVTAQQYFYILSGTATFYLEQEQKVIPAHEGLLITPGCRHYIANETAERLDFLVISQPTTNEDRFLDEPEKNPTKE